MDMTFHCPTRAHRGSLAITGVPLDRADDAIRMLRGYYDAIPGKPHGDVDITVNSGPRSPLCQVICTTRRNGIQSQQKTLTYLATRLSDVTDGGQIIIFRFTAELDNGFCAKPVAYGRIIQPAVGAPPDEEPSPGSPFNVFGVRLAHA